MSTDIQEDDFQGNLNSITDDGFSVIEDDDTTKVFVPPQDTRAAMNKVPNETIFDGTVMERETPNFTGEFEIHADRLQQLGDVVRIQSDIQTRGTISVEDASRIDAIIPGFLNEENPAALYTEAPTRTNLQEGLNNIDTVLEKNYDDLRTSIANLITQYMRINNKVPALLSKRFTAVLSDYNSSYACLLAQTEKTDAADVSFYLNNGKRISTFFEEPLSFLINDEDSHHSIEVAHSRDSGTERYENTFMGPYVKQFKEIFKEYRQNRKMQTLVASHGKLYYSGFDYYNVEEGKFSLIEDRDIIQNYEYNSYMSSVGDLMRFLINEEGLRIINAFINDFLFNTNEINVCNEASAKIQETEQPITLKIKELMEVSAKVNGYIQKNNTSLQTLEIIFGLIQVFTNLVKGLTEKTK